MDNQAIIERVIDALKSRGFADAEARVMIKRIQSGTDEITFPQDPIDPQIIKASYDRGYIDGYNKAKTSVINDLQRQMAQATRNTQDADARAQFAGLGNPGYGHIFSGIF